MNTSLFRAKQVLKNHVLKLLCKTASRFFLRAPKRCFFQHSFSIFNKNMVANLYINPNASNLFHLEHREKWRTDSQINWQGPIKQLPNLALLPITLRTNQYLIYIFFIFYFWSIFVSSINKVTQKSMPAILLKFNAKTHIISPSHTSTILPFYQFW